MSYTELKLIQGLEYPTACNHLKFTKDKKHLISCGTYKPRIKIHDLTELTQKLERHTDSEPLKVEVLENNHQKLAVLRDDRNIEFHAKYGLHCTVRIPTVCREMVLNNPRAELLVGGNGNKISIFNLEKGKFIEPYETQLEDINAIKVSDVHNLIGVVGNEGLELIDGRANGKSVYKSEKEDISHTAVAFSENGINMCVGKEDGTMKLFDLRMKKELKTEFHKKRVKEIIFTGKNIASIDENCLKVWNLNDKVVEIPTDEEITTFDIDSGIFVLGFEGSQIRTYFLKEIGDLPVWCRSAE